MIKFLLVPAILFGGYQLIPNIYARHFSKDVTRRLKPREREIALTFDDGPHETYTPELLDLLKAEGVSATFFLVAQEAQKHPELVRRMQNEGHAIGLHSLSHRGFWLETPGQTRRDFEKSMEIINRLGVEPVGFRPPWGTFNLLTLHHARRMHLPVYLWSRNAKDWDLSTKPQDIADRMTRDLEAGEIIVLHDAGGDQGAPGHTLQALKTALPALKKTFAFTSLKQGGKTHDLFPENIPSI